ncbi:SDR family oxidoreductase [Oceanirhabdus seepicola]|uniref:SDR family oxidoreductase n=1 Tax=Oceanirhabdus seepicola TaxID=2828781 RepID=A0A9J6NUW7_9CLOT|nr:SDR family oxidoreductase [Oceanirhabdus seepicola]MCM1988266.1 SDR family oxidoreductase [Oceanirhabdus seepicola]
MSNVFDMFKLDGKVALITGSATGIGQAIAVALAEAGADIVGIYNRTSPEETKRLVEQVGRKYHAIQCNLVNDLSKCQQVIDEVVEKFGKLDILVNSSGSSFNKKPEDIEYSEYEFIINLNQNSVFLLCQAAGKQFIKQGTGGKIINIASLATFRGQPNGLPYSASKHALAGITKSLAAAWADKNINVNGIAPGLTITPMTEGILTMDSLKEELMSKLPAKRFGYADDMKGIALYLASPASDFCNGVVIPVDGGQLAW